MIVDFSFPLEELEYFLLILARVSGFMFTAPFFSQNHVPRMLKAALAVLISYLLYEAIMPHVPVVYHTLIEYTGFIIMETLVGIMIGLAAAFAMNVSAFAGQIVDTDIGFSMSAQMDPVTMQNTTVTGYLYQYTFMLIFMVTGMHRYLLLALSETFELIPLGQAVLNKELMYDSMIRFMGEYIMMGFRIALPIFAVILLVNCMLGVMAKVSPQMNMFAVGIQIKSMIGLIVLFVTIGILPDAAEMIFKFMRTNVATVVRALMP
jgi:flagellar biosynthetic protein FliR